MYKYCNGRARVTATTVGEVLCALEVEPRHRSHRSEPIGHVLPSPLDVDRVDVAKCCCCTEHTNWRIH